MKNEHRHQREDCTDYEEGIVTVSSPGEVEITLNFEPEFVDVIFADPEPNHHCCDIDDHDKVKVAFVERNTFELKWFIKSTRVISWIAVRLKK